MDDENSFGTVGDLRGVSQGGLFCIHSFYHLPQNVRRVALVAFNSAAHNKPSLIRDLLGSLLPNLYMETKVRVRKTSL